MNFLSLKPMGYTLNFIYYACATLQLEVIILLEIDHIGPMRIKISLLDLTFQPSQSCKAFYLLKSEVVFMQNIAFKNIIYKKNYNITEPEL